MELDEGGDAACWLSRTCPACGAMPTADDDGDGLRDADGRRGAPVRCWRCGEPLPPVVEDPAGAP